MVKNEKNYMICLQKKHLGGSGTCEGTLHEERKRTDDAI